MKHWARRGAIAWLLWPVSLVFGFAVLLRKFLYATRILRSEHPGIPVIVVGNLTVGGTGKTPLVELLATLCRERGRSPAVLSRGYRGEGGEGGANDEARMLTVPVFCDASRSAAGARALAAGHDCLLLDDGFQHRRLARDLDLVLIDALRPWGVRGSLPAVLPLGLMREPKRALRRADALVVTRADTVDERSLAALTTQLARFGKRQIGDGACGRLETFRVLVVEHDQLAVFGEPEIEFHAVGVLLPAEFHRGERVFRRVK